VTKKRRDGGPQIKGAFQNTIKVLKGGCKGEEGAYNAQEKVGGDLCGNQQFAEDSNEPGNRKNPPPVRKEPPGGRQKKFCQSAKIGKKTVSP